MAKNKFLYLCREGIETYCCIKPKLNCSYYGSRCSAEIADKYGCFYTTARENSAHYRNHAPDHEEIKTKFVYDRGYYVEAT